MRTKNSRNGPPPSLAGASHDTTTEPFSPSCFATLTLRGTPGMRQGTTPLDAALRSLSPDLLAAVTRNETGCPTGRLRKTAVLAGASTCIHHTCHRANTHTRTQHNTQQ